MKTVTRKKQKRDYTKYVFQGRKYGKGPLVLAIVGKYVEEHPKATIEELQAAFPKDEIKSTFEIVETIRKANKRRFFLKPDRVLRSNGSRLAVTNQWSRDNTNNFIKYVKKNHRYNVKIA